ncbi:MAG TPA: hypothetical protein ENI23_12950, partial [bacterium]|nr:hypothetical protein [bacterium]
MPYIEEKRRFALTKGGALPENPGELNFYFTWLAGKYLQKKGERYQTYNDIMGALEGSKLEIYRRLVSAYEDKKIKENGDIFN